MAGSGRRKNCFFPNYFEPMGVADFFTIRALRVLACHVILELMPGHKKFKIDDGFTLIELIVVMGILALVVGAITLFISSVLKGSNQAKITAEVKQNGQVTLDSLERQIRGAVDVVGDVNDGSTIKGIKVIRNDASAMTKFADFFKCLATIFASNPTSTPSANIIMKPPNKT